MKNDKSKNIIIVLLVIIIIILGALVILFATNKITFNSGNIDSNNQQKLENKVDENNKIITNDEAISIGTKLYDKVTEIYETWNLRPYCGIDYTSENDYNTEELGNSEENKFRYYKSNFTSIDSLKEYLKEWLSDDIINSKVQKTNEYNGETYYKYLEDETLLSGSDPHYMYVDYILKDNTLYCRLDSGKGWVTMYLDKYNLTVNKIEENKITYTVSSAYVSEEAQKDQNSTCSNWPNIDISKCSENEIEYKNTSFVIEKNSSGNWVVSSYTLHE